MTLEKLTIGLDFDGVIIDHTKAKQELAAQHGFSITPSQTASETLKLLVGEEINRKIQRALYNEVTLLCPKIPDADLVIQGLQKNGHRLLIISARYPQNQPFAVQWMREHLGGTGLSLEEVIFVSREEEKDGVCKEQGVCIYLDDKLSVLDFLKSVEHRILFDPHDSYGEEAQKAGYLRVKTWQEFGELVERITAENKD